MKRFLLLLIVFLSACTQVTLLDGSYPPVSKDHVKVIVDNDDISWAPHCNAVQIAQIRTKLCWNQSIALNEARDKAAEIGADYIKAYFSFNQYNDAMVTATAYKCQ